MYARQPPDTRFPRNVRVPQNYSGSAFRREEEIVRESVKEDNHEHLNIITESSNENTITSDNSYNATKEEDKDDKNDKNEIKNEKEESSAASKSIFSPGFKLDLGHLFQKKNGFGIGLEELLIIGLIFLISQNDNKDDLILLLLLLLFIQ